MTTKLLVAGDVKGSLDQLFLRAAAVHSSKGPFDCMLCVGDFFGEASAAELLEPFKSGERKVPLPTYLLGPPPADAPTADPDGKLELCPDLYCLAGTGIITLHGLRVGFTDGRAGGTQLTDAVAELRRRTSHATYLGCDVLLTCDWPRGFFRKVPADGVPADVLPERELPEVGSEQVAEMACCVQPRYHFCGTEDTFFARAPYRQGSGSVCRLVCLAAVNADPKKKKWLHALALAPMATMAAEQLRCAPEGTTDSPYPYALRASTGEDAAQCAHPVPPNAAAVAGGGGGVGGGGGGAGDGALAADAGGGTKRKRPEFAKEQRSWVADTCWFCMASAQFETHLVVSVGEEVYASVAKGPLLPMHALLLPIAHKPCSLLLSDSEAAELQRYVAALRKCFLARGFALLLFERYMASGTFEHMHVQAVPLPAQLAGGVRAAFEAHGRRLGLHFEMLAPSETLVSRMPGGPEPFFAATLPSGETLLHLHRTNPRRHPLQFGREVVAALLGNPDRADWKKCMPQPAPGERASTVELEARGASEFKRCFAPFEPEVEE